MKERKICRDVLFKKKDHEEWIDISKGIAVVLVVLGHFWYRSDLSLLNQIIYSFHVPLFFILSGYLINYKEESFGLYV